MNNKGDNIIINDNALKEMKIQFANEMNSTSNSGHLAVLENNNVDFNILPLNKHFQSTLT